MIATAVIVAPGVEGLTPIFGVPAIRRLVLVLARLGFCYIHVVGRTAPLVPVLGDLVPRRFFHLVEGDDSLEEVVRDLRIPCREKLLVLEGWGPITLSIDAPWGRVFGTVRR